MKKVICQFLFASLLLFSASSAKAQAYNNAIGLRLGIYNGITYKQFLNEKSAFEIFGTFRTYGVSGFASSTLFTATGTYQLHFDIPDVENLRWYVGGGATFWTGAGFGSFGITGIAGLEYTLPSAPVNFSLDWTPTFLIGDGFGTGFTGDFFALSVRYTLGRK